MQIDIQPDRIEFFPKKGQKAPEVFQFTGLAANGNFEVEPQIVLRLKPEQKYYCKLNHGIYALFAQKTMIIVLLPHRVRLTLDVARELLANGALPPPRLLDDAIAKALSDLIICGAPWQEATKVLGVGSNGHRKFEISSNSNEKP